MLNNKKILIVTPFFYPAWSYGGPPRVMFDLATALSTDNISIECIATDVFDKERYEKKTDKINNITITYFKNVSNYLAYYFKFFWPIGFKKYLKNNLNKFDVIHIADFRNLCTYYAYRECVRQKIPYIITPFGTMPYTKGLKGIIKKIIDKIWGIECLKKAKYVIVQTENEINEALKLGVNSEKIILIPLMIDSKKFAVSITKNDIREKYNIPLSAKIILFVGRLNKHKATDNMLLAIAKFIKDNPDQKIKFLIVGRDDGNKNHLEKLSIKLGVEKNVIFLGPIFYPDIVSIYKASDVFLMAPSHFEETSTASLEALASGTPIVVTKQADIPYFDDYQAGSIVRNEVDELAIALKKILIENRFKKEDCMNIIKNHFDIGIVSKNYSEIYFR